MAITIRPLDPHDRASWQDLWTAYLTFYETRVDQAVYDSTWERLMGEAYYDGRGLIAAQGGTAVGLAHYFFQRHGWRVEDVTYLQDLYVRPEVRGTGAGRALIEAVYRAADAAGCGVVYWTTAQDNAVARRLYDRIASVTPFIKYQR